MKKEETYTHAVKKEKKEEEKSIKDRHSSLSLCGAARVCSICRFFFQTDDPFEALFSTHQLLASIFFLQNE